MASADMTVEFRAPPPPGRDELAAMAMQGLAAGIGPEEAWVETDLARTAYRVADAMLAEREKGRVARAGLLAALKECRSLVLYAAEGAHVDAPRCFAAVRAAAAAIAKAEGRSDG